MARKGHSQWIANMCGVSNKQKPSLTERRGASLLQFVWADISDRIIGRFRTSWQYLSITIWLSFLIFLRRQSWHFTIRHTIQVVIAANLRNHMPILGIYNIIRIPITILCKVMYHLTHGSEVWLQNARKGTMNEH